MKPTFLTTNTQFGLDLKAGRYDELIKNFGLSNYMNIRNNFDAFLSKPLQIGFFVPSVDGVPLVKPHNYGLLNSYPTGNPLMDESFKDALEYEAALSRCLFTGFTSTNRINGAINLYHPNVTLLWDIEGAETFCEKKTIESLTQFGLELSSTTIEGIFGKIN